MAYYQPQGYGNNIFNQLPQQYYYQPNLLPTQMSGAVQVGGLNGKVVESAEIVKATEVPFNGYGIFPKVDLSEIYIKNWCPDGTTKITTYIPVVDEPEKKEEERDEFLPIIKEIQKLSKKIDELSKNPSTPMKRRKGVDEDE